MLGFKASRHCHWRGSEVTTFLNPWYNDIVWYLIYFDILWNIYVYRERYIWYCTWSLIWLASPPWNGCQIHIRTYFGSDVPRPRRHDYCQELLHSWPWSEKTLGDALSWVPGVKPLDMASPPNETMVFCWEFPHSIGTMQLGCFILGWCDYVIYDYKCWFLRHGMIPTWWPAGFFKHVS